MNIVSMAMQYLTPMLVDRIASSLGIQSALVRSAINAILPSILAGLTGVAARPSGGRQLGEALGKQDTDILGNLGDIFGSAKQTDIVKSGNNVLRDLLGGSTFGGLTGAVGKFAGIGEAPVQTLVGMLAPVALGTLAKQKQASGLDDAGLSRMLLDQRENIKAAMPAGFSEHLKGTGLLDAISPPSAPAAPAASPVAKPAGGLGMLPLVAAAALLAVLGWYFFGQNRPATIGLPTPPQITVGGQNLGSQLGSVAEGLRGTLVGLKDEASARTALPRLQEMQQQLAGIGDSAAKLQPDARKSLAGYAAQLLPLLRPLIEKALAAAGVGPIAKPVLDQILNRIEGLAKA